MWRKAFSFSLASILLAYNVVWPQNMTPAWREVTAPGIHLNNRAPFNGIEIPYNAGQAREVFSGKAPETIVNIQDAHASLAAQNSILQILDKLADSCNLDLIALEGAEGPVDVSLLKTFPDSMIRRDIANYFVREGKMSAGEYFAIVSEKPIKLYGVENGRLYRANIKALNDLMENRTVCLKNIHGLLNTLKAIEPKVYSDELLELNKNSVLHKDGKLAFTRRWDFIEKLAKRNGIETAIFTNLSKLLKSMELEKDIDFARANKERKQLIDELSGVLPEDELEKLVLKSMLFKKKEISQADFHQYIAKLARDAKLNPAPYANLVKFTRYITLYESIDLPALFQEIEQMEAYIREKLFRNDEERSLYNITKAVRIMERLFTISMDNDDYDFIISKKRYFDRTLISDFIKKAYLKYGLVFEHDYDLDLIFDNIEKAVEFYNIAQRRNKFMVANTLRVMRKHGEKFSSLIAGGFHSRGLASILKKKSLSYLVVTPKFKDGGRRPYLAVLSNKRYFHEELLDADEYILAAPALFWTETPEEILKGLFGAYGLAYLNGMPVEPLMQEHYRRYREYFEREMGKQRAGERHLKIPFTPKQFAEILGLDKNGMPLKEGGSGLVIKEVKIKGKEYIVVRSYKEGTLEHQVALTRDEEGGLTLGEVVPEEVVKELRRREKTRKAGKREAVFLQRQIIDRIKTLLREEEIIGAFMRRLYFRACLRGISPAEVEEKEKLALLINTLRSKGVTVSPRQFAEDKELKKAALSAINELSLPHRPLLTPAESERISEIGLYNLRYRKGAKIYAAQRDLTEIAKQRLEITEKGVYDITVYSLDEVKRQAEAHRARNAEGLTLRIRLIPPPEERAIIEKTGIPALLDLMGIAGVLKAENLIVADREESIANIYNEYRLLGYKSENIIIVNKHRELTDDDKAIVGKNKIVVVQYRDVATKNVYYYALELWARGEPEPSDTIPGLPGIKGREGLLIFILPPVERSDFERLTKEIEKYRRVLIAA